MACALRFRRCRVWPGSCVAGIAIVRRPRRLTPPQAVISFLKGQFRGERPAPEGVTAEHLPGPETARFPVGRSPTRPMAHWVAPLGCAGRWIALRARDLRAERV